MKREWVIVNGGPIFLYRDIAEDMKCAVSRLSFENPFHFETSITSSIKRLPNFSPLNLGLTYILFISQASLQVRTSVKSLTDSLPCWPDHFLKTLTILKNVLDMDHLLLYGHG